MARARDIAHELGIAARIATRGLRRRLSGGTPPPVTDDEFRATLQPWLGSLPHGLLAGHAFYRLPATQPPWFDTGVELAPGESVTLLADGRVYFFSEDGKTIVVEAGRTFKVLAENTLGDGFMASPAIAGKAFFVRSHSHLYRIES